MGPFWNDHDLVCPTQIGTPVEPRSFNRHADQLRTKLGINFTPHDLRHTMVTLLLEWGTPPHIVQALARHAGIEMTMNVYAHANLDAMREAVNQFDQRL
jgi:integrase